MATMEQITAALARTEERCVERIESGFRDLGVHLHAGFDALEERFDSTRPERRGWAGRG